MPANIFINLPVANLKKSVEFFSAIGLSINPQFTDKNAACLILSETAFVMLISKPFFKSFTSKEIVDAKQQTEVLIAIQVATREKVVEITKKAEDAGALITMNPQDHEWMYQQSFADLDGHMWELIFMDDSKFPKQ